MKVDKLESKGWFWKGNLEKLLILVLHAWV
jgi:hypothetical protein